MRFVRKFVGKKFFIKWRFKNPQHTVIRWHWLASHLLRQSQAFRKWENSHRIKALFLWANKWTATHEIRWNGELIYGWTKVLQWKPAQEGSHIFTFTAFNRFFSPKKQPARDRHLHTRTYCDGIFGGIWLWTNRTFHLVKAVWTGSEGWWVDIGFVERALFEFRSDEGTESDVDVVGKSINECKIGKVFQFSNSDSSPASISKRWGENFQPALLGEDAIWWIFITPKRWYEQSF